MPASATAFILRLSTFEIDHFKLIWACVLVAVTILGCWLSSRERSPARFFDGVADELSFSVVRRD